MWAKPVGVLKLVRKNISGMSKHVLMDQTLRNMHGHSTIAKILTILVSSTKALFALDKLWRLGTPLQPSMLTIILSRFQTSIEFFLNNSHLSYTFLLCFCFSSYFYLAFSCIYFIFCIPFFIRRKL